MSHKVSVNDIVLRYDKWHKISFQGYRSEKPEPNSPWYISPTLGIWISIFTLHCLPMLGACTCSNNTVLASVKKVKESYLFLMIFEKI